jgi:misacylated tRNA(Ala) deacylase
VLLWGGVQTHIVGARPRDDLWLIPDPADPLPPAGTQVRGAIDDVRRTMLMRTHSGLHVLCGVMTRDYGVPVTGGNMEPGEARLDFDFPEVPPGFKDRLTEALNAEVQADRAIEVRVLPREEAYALGPIIKTATDLLPPELEVVRLIDVTGLDLQADGGTHVASTRQIGRIEVTKVENKGRGFRRVRVRLP